MACARVMPDAPRRIREELAVATSGSDWAAAASTSSRNPAAGQRPPRQVVDGRGDVRTTPMVRRQAGSRPRRWRPVAGQPRDGRRARVCGL